MKKKLIFISILLPVLMLSSCIKDLDVKPKDPNSILSGNLSDDPAYLKQVLGKIYQSFMFSGESGTTGPDIVASDNSFFTTVRSLWNLQEITTDEAICAWGDVGIADLNTQTWSPENPFLTALYQRLGLTITYANEFIRFTDDMIDADVVRYNAEARFLRALAYTWHMDLFGNPPFTTEEDEVGNFFPEQLDADFDIARRKMFDYIVGELHGIEDKLGEPGTNYPQADQAAAWMLLARLYLNAEVYTGTEKWDSCIIYCNKVITSGEYSLATDYRQNFCADNNYPANPEMIFAFEQDGTYAQGWVGTTFIIESSSDATYIRAEDYHGLTSNTNWNGNRSRKDFLDIMVDTLAIYGGAIDVNDTIFDDCPDNRVFLRQKLSINIPNASSNGDYGIGVYKFTAKNHDGTLPANFNAAYACTDFPVFRLSEAYLMRAEANFRSSNIGDAVDDINFVRQRAYGDNSGDIDAGDLTEEFLLGELAREFYYEAHRRTDLVRFGQFTDGTYHWQWKGGIFNGVATNSYRNVFPIPGTEVSANPNITQNPGY
jgi:hypothetical protein